MREPMDTEGLERLLRGYRVPPTPVRLDQRVLEQGLAIIGDADARAWSLAEIAHGALHRLGFGHVAWLIDLVTTTDAEYRVEFA